MFFRFVYLQLFLTPHSSSFTIDKKTDNSSDTLDLNIVPEVISLLMAIIYSTFPGMLHIILHAVNNPIRQILSLTVLVSVLRREVYVCKLQMQCHRQFSVIKLSRVFFSQNLLSGYWHLVIDNLFVEKK